MGDSAISERDRLQHFLDRQRNAVLAIIEGLDEAQLNTPVLPSGWTPNQRRGDRAVPTSV